MYTIGSLCQISYDEIRCRPPIRQVLAAIAGFNQEGCGAAVAPKIDITGLIPDHKGFGGVESEVAGGLRYEAKFRLTAGAAILRSVWADIDAIRARTGFGEEFGYSQIHPLDISHSEVPASDAGLVAHDHD